MVSFVGDGTGPVLGEPTDGLSLYVADTKAIRRIELDTGRVTTLPLTPSSANGFYAMDVVGEQVVLSNGPAEYSVGRDLSGGIMPVVGGRYGNRIPGTDVEWTQLVREGAAVIGIRRPDTEDVEVTVPPGLNFQGFVGDRVVLAGGGRIFLLDMDGRIHAYAAGSVSSTTPRWILYRTCDERARCSFRLGDVEDANARDVNLPDNGLGWGEWGFANQVAPDGRHALLPSRQGTLDLVDLTAGAVVFSSLADYGGWAWSPDGAWLFRIEQGGAVEAIASDDGQVVTLLEPTPGTTSSARVLAVG
jgi:hypothetical protein